MYISGIIPEVSRNGDGSIEGGEAFINTTSTLSLSTRQNCTVGNVADDQRKDGQNPAQIFPWEASNLCSSCVFKGSRPTATARKCNFCYSFVFSTWAPGLRVAKLGESMVEPKTAKLQRQLCGTLATLDRTLPPRCAIELQTRHAERNEEHPPPRENFGSAIWPRCTLHLMSMHNGI